MRSSLRFTFAAFALTAVGALLGLFRPARADEALLAVGSPTVAALDRDGWISRYRDDKYAVLSAPAPGTATSRP